MAYIAGRAISDRGTTSVFDYSMGGFATFSGSISQSQVNVFDHLARCHVSGSRHGNQFSLFHYGNGRHLSMKVEGYGSFSGFDYSSSSHFSGTITGSSISLYDYESGGWFSYGI